MKSNHYRVKGYFLTLGAMLSSHSFAQTPPAPVSTPTIPVADIGKGQQLFQERCALCHAIDAATVAQGPRLNGVIGRASASLPEFSYTDVLRRLRFTWDEKSLDRFLANPMLIAPGTTMPIGLPDAKERRDVIAYLASLSSSAEQAAMTPAIANDPGHWRHAKPGRQYRIEVDSLPAPYASRSTGNFPRIVEQPAEATLFAPEGFVVKPFATGLQGPRTIRIAPNGDIFIAETRSGRITVMRASLDGEKPQQTQVFASDLKQPFGIAFYPAGADPRWVYVANNNSVVRFAYQSGDLKARSKPQTVISQLSPTSGGHTTRDIVFSKDDKRLFVSVGSASNVGEGIASKSAEELKRWQTSMPLGAAWGSEANRATVLAFSPEGKSEKIFATGLRNCVGMGVEPTSGELWCVVNERDALGDDLVPDFATRVRENHFYGWPWYYVGKHEDPRLSGARPDLADKATVPDVLLQAHSAPLHLAFYDATQGSSVFPVDFRGDAFIALHGSWNRNQRTGYKIVRIRMNGGEPIGGYEDFVTGFVMDDRSVWGRPVGIAIARDGSLLFTDDASNTVWRVSYANAPSK